MNMGFSQKPSILNLFPKKKIESFRLLKLLVLAKSIESDYSAKVQLFDPAESFEAW